MSLTRFPPTNRKAEADQSSQRNDRTPTTTYASNVTTAPSHSLSGRDFVGQPDENESSLTDTIVIAEKSNVATTKYIYYQIHAEDGAIPSKIPVTPADPFLGRIKAKSIPPPRTVKAVKRSITKVENIKGGESTSLFLTPYSQSPMDDADMVIFRNGTGPGSTPQEPLAVVAEMSDSERSALEFERRGGLASAAEPVTTSPEIPYLFYRIYAESGAIPSKRHITPGDPFLGRIKVRSVPPPRTVKAVKRSITNVENIKGGESTSLFLTPYSQSPMDDEDKVVFFNGTGPGSTSQEPLALVAKMSNSERSALESERRGGLTSDSEPDTMPAIQYLYYLLYDIDCEMSSKVAFDPEQPSLGRIRADSVAPPHSPTSIKRYISRVEENPALAWYADLFADTEDDTPLKEGHISILRADGPGLSPNEPMAIVQGKTLSIPDGRYLIRNQAKDIYWNAGHNPISTVYFNFTSMIGIAMSCKYLQWEIKNDTNGHGNTSIKSLWATSSWVGADMTGSTVPVPWRLIPADGKSESYYLTTDMNHFSRNPRVPAVQGRRNDNEPGSMATLKEGDQWQMWEFIPVY